MVIQPGDLEWFVEWWTTRRNGVRPTLSRRLAVSLVRQCSLYDWRTMTTEHRISLIDLAFDLLTLVLN